MAKIYVLHENDAWIEPLAAAFAELELPWEPWFLDEGVVDFSSPPPAGVFYNRMSASAHTRGHRTGPELTQAVLEWLTRHGRRVVNGPGALRLEVSKVAQAAALERAGLRVPRFVAAVGRGQVLEAARRFGETPFILKPNRGGRGQGVQLFHSLDGLAAYLDGPAYEEPIDGTWLVQQYVAPRAPVITRCEFIGRRFLYAVQVDASQGFELCPADVCATDTAAGASAPAEKFTILEGFDDPILEAYGRFLHDTGIEVAGIEFIRNVNSEIFTYDVNTNTNYNARAEARAGRFGMRTLARFLGDELARLHGRQAA